MQSEPPRASQNDSLDSAQHPFNSDQYGLQCDHDESSATLLNREDFVGVLDVAIEPDAASVSSEGSRRGRNTYPGRLNRRSSSSQGSSPVNRVEEYERQNTYSRRTSDRITFQVVPSIRGSAKSVSIEEFPNGMTDLPLKVGSLSLTLKQRF